MDSSSSGTLGQSVPKLSPDYTLDYSYNLDHSSTVSRSTYDNKGRECNMPHRRAVPCSKAAVPPTTYSNEVPPAASPTNLCSRSSMSASVLSVAALSLRR